MQNLEKIKSFFFFLVPIRQIILSSFYKANEDSQAVLY